MKMKTDSPRIASRLLVLLMCGVSLSTVYGQDDAGSNASQPRREGMISDQEYRDGMEQKKLSLADPDQALKEDLWRPCASVALGDGYSVILQFRLAHPMVAEYQRRVMIFSGDARRGKLSGALQLRMNFGGCTHILIYRHLDKNGNVTHVTFERGRRAIGKAYRARFRKTSQG